MHLELRTRRVLTLLVRNPTAAAISVFVLPLVHIAVKSNLISFARLASLASRLTHAQSGHPAAKLTTEQRATEARQLAETVYLGVRLWRIESSSCTARSLILWTLGNRRQLPFRIVVGSHASTPHAFHSWVEMGDVVVDDSPDVSRRYHKFDQPLLDTQYRTCHADD